MFYPAKALLATSAPRPGDKFVYAEGAIGDVPIDLFDNALRGTTGTIKKQISIGRTRFAE